MTRKAIFSKDRLGPDGRGRYRYTLWRLNLCQPVDLFLAPPTLAEKPKAFVQWIGLNPSTATETLDDPTLRRCMEWTRRWGYDQMVMTNLFAFRATDPEDMEAAASPEGPDNDAYLTQAAKAAAMVVFAWGDGGLHLERELRVRQLLARRGLLDKCWHLGRTRGGNPIHPMARGKMRLPDNIRPQKYR